ncbi:MAG: rod shape-determining protein RodA [bacterium]|nr:rod shape-determining protein RodA [bacterium]
MIRTSSRHWQSYLAKFDWPLFFLWAVLAGWGLLTMWGMGNIAAPFLQKQLLFFVAGVFLMLLFPAIDYRVFKNYSTPALVLYAFSIILLVFALTSNAVRGINAWISIGSFRIEPSEFAKLALIVLLAKYFSQKHIEIYRIHHIIASGFYVGIPAALILIQPDLGSAFIFFVIWLAMLLASGVKRKHLLIILVAAVLAGLVAWSAFLAPYQKNRIISFVDPYLDPKGEGYSIIQSQIAIGSGGVWGMGFGKGTQSRFGFLPEAHTDFAFASFAEQFGFVGIVTCLILFLFLFFRIGKIGFAARNNFARLFSIGFVTFMFAHIMINAGMNLGVLPITGISFPFLSYGGSFLIALTLGVSMMQAIKVRS